MELITEQQKREIEYLTENIQPLWVRAKILKLIMDNTITGDWSELDYLLFCLDTSVAKEKVKYKEVRRIIR